MESDKPEPNLIASQSGGNASMTRPRKLLVFVLLAVLCAGHLYCVVDNKEHWPFSRYPMYSHLHRSTWTSELLVGTLREDPAQEIQVSFFVYDRPISVKTSLDHLTRKLDEDPSKADDLQMALLGLGKIYLDENGGHRPKDFRDIGTLRLVKVTWTVPPGEGHVRAEEIDREIVMEVQLPAEAVATASGGRR